MNTKSKKGGAQPGAGRPKLTSLARPHSLTIMISDEAYKAKSKLAGQLARICEDAIIKTAKSIND
jgi:hypothetical protein